MSDLPPPPQPPEQQPYTYAPPPAPMYAVAPKEPGATNAMIWGIVAVAGGMLCLLPILVSPVAWVLGQKSLNRIKANPHLQGRGEAMAGLVLGIIGTILLVIYVLIFALIIGLAISAPEVFEE